MFIWSMSLMLPFNIYIIDTEFFIKPLLINELCHAIVLRLLSINGIYILLTYYIEYRLCKLIDNGHCKCDKIIMNLI